MVQPANSSVSLALSRRPRNSRERWAAAAEYSTVSEARVLSKTVTGHRQLGAGGVIPRPVRPAEVAQARAFESLLLAESAELHDLAHRVAGGEDRLSDNGSAPSWDLLQIRKRVEEIQLLLRALRGRFPHQLSDCDR